MSLQVNYGNFLRKKESNAVKFNHNKPLISLAVSACMVFAITGSTLSGLALAYTYMAKPQQNYDINYFNKAQKLSMDVTKALGQLKDARPENINTIATIQTFTSAKPEGVDIDSFKITEKKYTVTATTKDMKLANTFLGKLNFVGREAAIGNIVTKDGDITFTIDVTEKAKAKAQKGGKK